AFAEVGHEPAGRAGHRSVERDKIGASAVGRLGRARRPEEEPRGDDELCPSHRISLPPTLSGSDRYDWRARTFSFGRFTRTSSLWSLPSSCSGVKPSTYWLCSSSAIWVAMEFMSSSTLLTR